MKPCLLAFLVIVSLFSPACGGGSGSTTPPPPTPAAYSIGGTLSGLTGTGLVLQNNGGNNLAVTANGSFTFSAQVNAGAAYNVSVLTQPSGPAQTCTVTGGGGTAAANVTTIQVACTNNVVTYTIGGSISGLSGSGLVLQDNGGDNLAVSSNGPFTFATPAAAYAVTVLTQPSSPAQSCALTNATGTASANVNNVEVACTTNPVPHTWTWIGGPNVVNQNGTYGTEGTAAAGNIPGSRDSASEWTDPSGNFWLFGGVGAGGGLNNDLWKYRSGEWTWMSGSNTPGQAGTYGTEGTADPANVPGARRSAARWIDASGNLWLFGGGDQSSTPTELLNDLWKYSSGEWTWMGGANSSDQSGVYGTEGTAAPTNIPGARKNPATWVDSAGNLWLFGGVGYDSTGAFSILNDLWEYSGGQWIWVSGSDTVGASGVYGTLGTAAPSNIPGARSAGASWSDASGNLWLFGGGGNDSAGTLGFLNDLWKYSAGQWTWMGGSNLANQAATYGTQGTPAADNIPAGRIQAVSWNDASGNFWLFGGYGLDSTASAQTELNDLWKYSAGEWTWISGSNLGDQPGIYGTQGVPALANATAAIDGLSRRRLRSFVVLRIS